VRRPQLGKEVWESVSSLLKVLEGSTFISVIFYTTQYAAAYGFLTERSRLLGILPFSSVCFIVASELCRRRLNQIVKAHEGQQATAWARSAEQLPQVEWKELRQEVLLEQEPSCLICLTDFSPDDLVSQLPCEHCFHAKCIRNWLSASVGRGCPLRCQQRPLSVAVGDQATTIGQVAV